MWTTRSERCADRRNGVDDHAAAASGGVRTAVDMCVWNVVRCLTQGWRVRIQLMPRMHLKTVRPSLKGLATGMGANEPTSMQDNGCQFYGEQMTWWKLDRIAESKRRGRAPTDFEPLFIHGSLIKAKEGLRHVFRQHPGPGRCRSGLGLALRSCASWPRPGTGQFPA